MFNLFNLFCTEPVSTDDSFGVGIQSSPMVDDFSVMGHSFEDSAGLDALNDMDMGMSCFDF